MASGLIISNYAVVLGKTDQPDWALQLDAMPVAPTLTQVNGSLLQFNMLPDIDTALPLPERLLALLQKLRKQLSTMPDTAPVLLVLPEQMAGEQDLAAFIFALQRAFPQLFSHKACQVFPYGRSAALMALAAARQLLNSGEPVVWIIGLDSPVSVLPAGMPALAERAEYPANEQVVWSEGAVAVALQRSNAGLNCHFLASDATVGRATDEPAIAQLFNAAAASVAGPLSRLYMADNGDSRLTACWQSQYHRLAKVLTVESQLSLTAYVTGELGAAGGVYRFLHLYLGYRQASHRGLTLQCEISERLYRAVAVFSWQQASSISEF